MRKAIIIAICMGFFLQAGANTGVTALLKDTSTLRNNQVAALPSPPASDIMQDIQEKNLNHALPLSLNLFKVALNYDHVLILWSTGQEPNIKYFTVERSTDGINYTFLGFLVASSEQSEKNDYRLTDNTPGDGINYYRLSQTDLNGKTRYYGSRIINKNSNDFSAGVINFSNGNIRMIINSSKSDNISLNLVDISGHEIKQETFTVATGSTSKTIVLPKGTYVAMLSNRAGERSVNKIVVQ